MCRDAIRGVPTSKLSSGLGLPDALSATMTMKIEDPGVHHDLQRMTEGIAEQPDRAPRKTERIDP
jgi:hypothetical protein